MVQLCYDYRYLSKDSYTWLRVDFSSITLDDHPFEMAFANYKIIQLMWFMIAYVITMC
jgi:hypothetical protein